MKRASARSRQSLLVVLALSALVACSPAKPRDAGGVRRSAVVFTPDVYLRASAVQLPAGAVGNAAPITVWAYGRCTPDFATCQAPTIPGPAITVQEGSALNIHVKNGLKGPFVEPTSVVIPGQTTTMQPVFINASTGAVTSTGARAPGDFTSRVRSFTQETPADDTTVVTYTWPAVKAGTYLYESGTHPSVQVQMGLYGALTVYPTTPGLAYDDPSSAFDSELTLVFSELDPVLHDAVASGHYGPNPNAPNAPPPGWLTSTVHYHPQYFLINGKPYSPTAPPLHGGSVGARLLVRMLNAGLETKVPLVQGPYLSLIAEDGNFTTITDATGKSVPAPRQQYAVLLPAGKTVDGLLVPTVAGDIPVYDRRLNLTNAGQGPGGMLVYLAVGRSTSTADGGVATTGALVASPNPLVFQRGWLHHWATLTVTNTGTAARIIQSASILPGGDDSTPSDFHVRFPGPLTVPGGKSVHLKLTCSPTTRSEETATLALGTDDPNTPTLSVSLVGSPPPGPLDGGDSDGDGDGD